MSPEMSSQACKTTGISGMKKVTTSITQQRVIPALFDYFINVSQIRPFSNCLGEDGGEPSS